MSGPRPPRVTIYTGKGGTGVTRIARAAARAAAAGGQRVLLIGDETAQDGAADGELPEPGIEFCAAGWTDLVPPTGALGEWLDQLAGRSGAGVTPAQGAALVPALRLAAALLLVEERLRDDETSTVIVDAPTGDAVVTALALLPRLVDATRAHDSAGLLRVLRPAIRRITGLPLPDDLAATEMWRLRSRLYTAVSQAQDVRVTAFRVVATDEPPVLRAARRTLAHLSLGGFPVDAVILNRHHDGAVSREALTLADPVALVVVPEVRGGDAAIAVRALTDALAVIPNMNGRGVAPGPVVVMEAAGDAGVEVAVPLPWVTPDRLTVVREGNRLMLGDGTMVRVVPLPPVAAGRHTARARFEAGQLRITLT